MIGSLKADLIDEISYSGVRRIGITLILVLTVWIFPGKAGAQETDPDSLLTFRFLKSEVELAEPGTFFNVLEVKNNQRDAVTGIVRFNCPSEWHIIGPGTDSLFLLPEDLRLIPIRVSIPGNTPGGISFLLGAELFGKDLYDYANSYISIKRKSRWDMRISTNQVYLSDVRPFGEFYVSIDISILSAPADKCFEISDIFVKGCAFCFFTSFENELINGILRYLL